MSLSNILRKAFDLGEDDGQIPRSEGRSKISNSSRPSYRPGGIDPQQHLIDQIAKLNEFEEIMRRIQLAIENPDLYLTGMDEAERQRILDPARTDNLQRIIEEQRMEVEKLRKG
jgi:hypothetical protein